MVTEKDGRFPVVPHINFRHVDGPKFSYGGTVRWLTRRERFLFALKLIDLEDLANAPPWPQ